MLTIRNLYKSYGGLQVLRGVNLCLKDDGIYCLMAPSGSGKTTLLRLILGLEQPDGGEIVSDFGQHPYAVVFQEDRLCEGFSPLENVALVCQRSRRREDLCEEMEKLLPKECLSRPVRTLSGGMRRRTAILRAVLAGSKALIMDEPFTGLDEDLRRVVIDYILSHREGRLLLVATHQPEDVDLLGAELLRPEGFLNRPD